MADVTNLIKRLYAIVQELETVFPGRHFTPDGHMVGSLGEAIAAEAFGLELVTASNEGFDALAKADGRRVEIKATQRQRIALQGAGALPDHVIALAINGEDGSARVVYNGPAAPVWEHAGPVAKNGQRTIAVSRLARLMDDVPTDVRLRQVGPLP